MSKQCRRGYELQHPMLLQTWTESGKDGRGQPTGSWDTGQQVRVKLQPMSGKTAEFAHQIHTTSTHQITMRYRSGVTVAHRFVYGSRTFNIDYVENIGEKNEWLRINVSESTE